MNYMFSNQQKNCFYSLKKRIINCFIYTTRINNVFKITPLEEKMFLFCSNKFQKITPLLTKQICDVTTKQYGCHMGIS